MSIDQAVDAAIAAIDTDRLVATLRQLVDIPSPTGGERPLAEFIVDWFRQADIEAHLQAIDDTQANAVGRIGECGDGPDLLLYAPIDTMTVGAAEHDEPWSSFPLEAHAVPQAKVTDTRVTGLGAHNPKGHVACVLAAVHAVAASGVPLRGRLYAGLGAGGMPTNAIGAPSTTPGDEAVTGRRNTGQGVGASFLLEQGVWPDAAIIAKSGWTIATAEVGLAWIEFTIAGSHTYVGARHRLPYSNPIVAAGTVAAFVDAWLIDYATRHADGEVAPQGVVAAARAGWWRMPAFVPACAKLRADVRLAPGQSPLDAWRELDAALEPLRAQGIDVTTDLVLAIPGSATDPDHWVCRTAVTAWERVTGSVHVAPTATSGATDANILRNRGIPTARVGLPKASDDGVELGFAEGMNTVDIAALELLTRQLVTAAVVAGSASRADLDLPVTVRPS